MANSLKTILNGSKHTPKFSTHGHQFITASHWFLKGNGNKTFIKNVITSLSGI